jgi:hypothetical protein
VPLPLVEGAARAGIGLLDLDTLRMLQRGNVAEPDMARRLLGHPPRPPRQFLDPELRGMAVTAAKVSWLAALLRIAVAIMWIAAGVVSMGLYPVADSLALLARTGLTGALAYAALYGAALLDLAFGIASLAMRRRRALWLAQIAVIAGYTAIITLALPEQWLHPYGPVVKNLPVLAAIYLLYELEER